MVTENPKATAAATAPSVAERERLLLENLPEVRYIARRVYDRLPSHVSFDDLVHAGILGLIDAVDKFDPSKNVQLKSYARFRIRGAILDSLRQMDWSPRNLRRQARRIEEARRELAAQFGRAPSEPELAAHLALPLTEFQHLLGDLRGLDLGSLHGPLDEGGAEDSISAVASRPEDDPFQQTFRSELRVQLARAIEGLGEKERQVLALYYLEELTMKEVGAILNIGESRVSQIHTAALIALRSVMPGGLAKAPGVPFATLGNSTIREKL
ncbi:MAG TPA: FliA/WhiG family RNA polymerase sigma factor [Candidatus Acidoferrum sp.]|nr:FliA/WhiG family RNA polymerase sigma factor [Candidatus Acidoferrum sp.]